MSDTVVRQLDDVRRRILGACSRSERDPDSVELIAVSKTFPVADIRDAMGCGQRLFGESRLQEATPKVEGLPADLEWHFIGRVQRNKVRKILPLFPFVHAVDSLKLACHIDAVAGEMGMRPKVFLQVNQAGELSKGGFDPGELETAMDAIRGFRHVETVGLMTIPPAVEDPEESRAWFSGLRQLRDDLSQRFSMDLPFLSMGMSGDFEIAIEEGASHVRVGSSIFGNREYKVPGELG